MESDAFFRKYLYDMKREQQKVGYVPVVVPFIVNGTGLWEFPTAAWGDAAVLIPWDLYLYFGDTAVLEAHAAEGYVFDRWSTGATANPLRIVVESDTVVTAYFVPAAGIASVKGGGAAFAVSPNPAHGEVSVTLAEASERGAELRLHDAAGREVLRRELSAGTRRATLEVSGLPAGTYFVTLTTAVGTGTRRLVID